MDLNKITPIIEKLFKEALEEPRYRFGTKYKGKGPKVASGSLRDSIKARVVKDTDDSKVIRMFGKKLNGAGIVALNQSLGQVVNDKRRPGKYAPIEPLEDWIKNKRSFKLRNSKGRFVSKSDKQAVKSAAYAISKTIKKFGIKPASNWIGVALKKVEKNKEIKQLLGQQATYDLMKILRDV